MPATASPAPAGFEAIPKSKVYQEIARQLQRHITARLQPGDLLPPERELARMLDVSRSSVRDAIRTLELMGLLEPRQGVGTVVCTPAPTPANPLADALLVKRKTIADLIDVREMIEPFLARRAALQITIDEIANLEDILLRQVAKVRAGGLGIEEDSQFHYAIAVASDNVAILKVVDVLMDLLRESRERSLQVEGRQEKSLAGHRRILSALKQGDAVAAEAAMRRHLQEIEEVLLKEF